VWGGSVTQWLGRWLVIERSRVQLLASPLPSNNSGQVVHTHVPLSPISIIWYRPKGGDALQLVTVGLASHWPCVRDSVVYPPTGSTALTGRWAPRLRSGGARPTLPFTLYLVYRAQWCVPNRNWRYLLCTTWNKSKKQVHVYKSKWILNSWQGTQFHIYF